eukprot:15358220-Alexandrium_andersonii.AAC.1
MVVDVKHKRDVHSTPIVHAQGMQAVLFDWQLPPPGWSGALMSSWSCMVSSSPPARHDCMCQMCQDCNTDAKTRASACL